MRVASRCSGRSVMREEDRATVFSVLVAATLSCLVVGIAFVATLVA